MRSYVSSEKREYPSQSTEKQPQHTHYLMYFCKYLLPRECSSVVRKTAPSSFIAVILTKNLSIWNISLLTIHNFRGKLALSLK